MITSVVEKCINRMNFLTNLAKGDVMKEVHIASEITRVLRKRRLRSTHDLRMNGDRAPILLHDLEALTL